MNIRDVVQDGMNHLSGLFTTTWEHFVFAKQMIEESKPLALFKIYQTIVIILGIQSLRIWHVFNLAAFRSLTLIPFTKCLEKDTFGGTYLYKILISHQLSNLCPILGNFSAMNFLREKNKLLLLYVYSDLSEYV